MVIGLFSEVKCYICSRIAANLNEIGRKYEKMSQFDARMIGFFCTSFFFFLTFVQKIHIRKNNSINDIFTKL